MTVFRRRTGLFIVAALLPITVFYAQAQAQDTAADSAKDNRPLAGDFELAPLGAPEPGLDASLLDALQQASPALAPSAPADSPSMNNVVSCNPTVCNHPDSYCVQVSFPDTEWRACIRDVGMKGLWVGPVDLRRESGDPWRRVLYEAGLAEIHVAYDQYTNGENNDLPDMRWGTQLPMTTDDAGPHGALLTLPGASDPEVVAEVRDRGPAWLCKFAGNATTGAPPKYEVRRGEELLLWGVYDGGDYDNIIQYGLRDDGTMTFRTGATGYNNNDSSATGPLSQTFEPHVHTGLWRVDIDLNGAAHDSAHLVEHFEPAPSGPNHNGKVIEGPFKGGKEGLTYWNPYRFTSLTVEDQTPNVHGNPMGYSLVPIRTGSARHFGASQVWTHFDLGVTQYKNPHAGPKGWTQTWMWPDDYLLDDWQEGGSVIDTDLVLWHNTSSLHTPHDEDRAASPYTNELNGVTNIHWSGFDMEPHNLFNHNPLGGPGRCGP